MKRFWNCLGALVLILMLIVLPQDALTQTVQAATSGDYIYTVSGGKATITDFSASYSGALTIPSTLGGYPVTSIGDDAFQYCTGLTSITIPDSVTSIGKYAFDNCTGLTSVTIGNSVTSIGSGTFYGCTGLTSVHITDLAAWCAINFSGSHSNPLYYANNLYLNEKKVTDLVIPDSVTSIGDYAFSYCSGLTSITISDSVTSIGEDAFFNCDGLTSVTIGNSVTSIGDWAFAGCTGLTSITIGNSVISIGDDAFSDCTGLTSITIPDSVTSIGSYTFYGCTGLTSVRFYSRKTVSQFKSMFNSGVTILCLCKDDQHLYTQYSDFTCEVCMFARAPLAPTIAQVTDNSITLTTVEGYEYKIDDFTWTTNPTFTGLNPITTYTFYQRVAESDMTHASESSVATTVTTLKSTVEAPNAPMVSGKTDTTITLVAVDGHEYKMNDGEWATNPIFTGLNPNKAYTFYQRVAETDTTCASDASAATMVTTLKSAVAAPAAPVVAEKTDCKITLVGVAGYEYKMNDGEWTADPIFTGLSPVTEYTFYQRIVETDTTYVSESSVATTVTTLKSTVGAPNAPMVSGKTDTTITLVAVEGYEYKMNDGEWTTNPIFTGLNPNKAYTFYQRVAETDTTYVSESSVAITVTTLKSTVEAPNAPIMADKTNTTITLVAVDGYEYKMGSGEWTTNPIFTRLNPNTEYTFYQRVAETDTTYVSESSEATTATTLKSTVAAPNAPVILEKTDITITLRTVIGYEYKIGDGEWTTNPLFTGLNPNTEYTFYQRVAETDTTYASESSVATAVTTLKSTVAAPNAPMVSGKTDTTITLVAVDGYEYKMGNGEWTTNPIFTGLNPNKEYTFYQRVAETDTTYVSAVSEATKVTTLKSTVAAPAAPIIAEKTDTTVTLQTVLGYEYKMDDGAWTTDPVFTDLDPETEYSFYQRVAETETTYASASSVGTKVTTEASFVPGWFSDNGVWYYYNTDGTLATGWVYDSAWYYMDANGVMLTGWVYDGAWYYMNSSGAMQTGWLYDGAWYYLTSSGAMATGWVNDGGTWYYMNGSGAMMTGWVNDGGTWYYMNSSGAMATGWVNDGGTWYYMNSSGAMATGWVNDGGTWYYMNPNGAMATGWILDGGVWYYLDASGAWVA